MVAGGEDELICDFAQTYHILDWRGLPLPLAATLASGLPEDSRCKLRLDAARAPKDTVLLATLVDLMSLLLWQRSKPGTSRPASIAETLVAPKAEAPRIRRFRSGADFDRALQRFLQ